MLLVWCERTQRHLPFEEKIMADFTKLMADIADLSAKVDALVAKTTQPPPDEQPAVDQAAAAVEAIAAKIPA
jgi:outer membrane murein-binding lipoprotein Lpp